MNVCRAVHCIKILDVNDGWEVETTPALDDRDADRWFSDRDVARAYAAGVAAGCSGVVRDFSTDAPEAEAAEVRDSFIDRKTQSRFGVVLLSEWIRSENRHGGEEA